MNNLYSAVISDNNKISVFDTVTGVRKYSISLGDVQVVNGPIVAGEKITVVVKNKQGKMQGRVYTIKTGVLSYSFFVK
jgi:tRNA-binding EMAP/Myf-like protein